MIKWVKDHLIIRCVSWLTKHYFVPIEGYFLILVLYCIYRRPEYRNGSYIRFTQTLYKRKAYRIMANLTSALCVLIIVIGIVLIIQETKKWTQYIIALILMVMASRNLVLNKKNGLNIDSVKFCRLEISRGNLVMQVLNFFLTTNAVVLDEMEVQVINKGFSSDAAAPVDQTGGCLRMTWAPLSDESIYEFIGRNGHEMMKSKIDEMVEVKS